ncbi:YkvI family membrane protein [Micrococcus porci]|uniref:YkvI family membrane protein n=1 Tax=Micrococcus porci TaxID=2856555 RepID=UPI003CEDAD7A
MSQVAQSTHENRPAQDGGHGLRPTSALGIAATFIGTTIGAGYASGNEILQYFVSFGLWGGTGALVIAGVLFFLLSAIVLKTAQQLRTTDIHRLVNPTSSRIPTWFADLCITASLLGTLVIMFAGAGAALDTWLGLPAWAGAALMATVCVLTVLGGISGLVKVQGLVVPLIILVAVGVAWRGLAHPGAGADDVASLVTSSPLINTWWMSGILYVAFNFQLAYAVLAPIGKGSSSPGTSLVAGAGLGAIGLVVMAGAIMAAMGAHATLIGRAELPMVELAGMVAPWVAAVYTVILLLAQFTTAVSRLFGGVERIALLSPLRDVPGWLIAVVTAVVAALLSSVGFSDLVGIVYPVLGYAGIAIVAMLIATWILDRTLVRRRAARAARA